MELLYSIEDKPPWFLCVLLGFQHYLTMFSATLAKPLILGPAMCIGNNYLALSEILATMLFVTGLASLLQTTIGVRLPIILGTTAATLVPTFAILKQEKWQCPEIRDFLSNAPNFTYPLTYDDNISTTTHNDSGSAVATVYTGSPEHNEIWQSRMREIQGSIILASLLELALGMTGLLGVALRYIGPLTIAPTITLIGVSLFGVASKLASKNWLVAMLTIALITVFSQYLANVEVPWCSYDRKKRRFVKSRFQIFKPFPVILAVVLMWLGCAILTMSGVIPPDPHHWAYEIRTDTKTEVLHQANWIRIPYPGQWGRPTFSTASVCGMLAAIVVAVIDAVGDYYAAARISGAPPPPVHAINRGIFIDGFSCLCAGLWGMGTGIATYSSNVGALGITKVASRRVIQYAGFIIMLLGILGKFGALFVTIPEPIIGGLFMVVFGMVTAVGISNLQFVDLNSSRNLFICGFSMVFGLSLSQWFANHPGIIKTGNEVFDQSVSVLLGTSMLVGGATGFILDNTIPGTAAERGMLAWRQELGGATDVRKNQAEAASTCYDLPYVTKYLHRWRWTSFLPLSPTFTGGGIWKWCNNEGYEATEGESLKHEADENC